MSFPFGLLSQVASIGMRWHEKSDERARTKNDISENLTVQAILIAILHWALHRADNLAVLMSRGPAYMMHDSNAPWRVPQGYWGGEHTCVVIGTTVTRQSGTCIQPKQKT